MCPVTVNINGTIIAFDKNRNIVTDVEYEFQNKRKTHTHFTLPFELTPEMVITITGKKEKVINVADYYSEGYGRFKIVSKLNPDLYPDRSNTLPDDVEYFILLGDNSNMVFGGDTLNSNDWDKKNDKHWIYKLLKK